jgi:predicted membrane chloride channel (bestrophin family)
VISYDSKNWLRILREVPRSRVFRTLGLDVLGAGIYARLVVYLETEVIGALLPLGASFLSILGIILGLLLVFRTNTAYDRWWEGRKLWGQLVNISRGLSRQLDAMLGMSRMAEMDKIVREYEDKMKPLRSAAKNTATQNRMRAVPWTSPVHSSPPK